MKSPIRFLTIFCIGILIAINSIHSAAADERPNIIILYIDDLARGDVGAFGCPDPGTSNIDRLAKQGVKLDNAYTHNAPCSPSRTALMLGMYTQRFGKYDLSRGVPIPDDKATLAETLRDAGYTTGFIGHEKWDIGKWDQGAMDRGFMISAKQPPRVKAAEGNGNASFYLDMKGNYLPETEGDYAVEFITQHAKDEKPFFLYYAPLSVHTPLHEVPKKYLDRLYPGHEGKYSPRQQLRASLLAIDDQIGRIIDKLDETKLTNETLILFSSDNGGDPGAQARPLPFRGGKGGENRSNLQWEGNYRMPTIISFPGTIKPGTSFSGMSSTIDFYATATAVAKTPLPPHCEGINLLPLLTAVQQPDPERILFWNTHGSQIARWKNWRIVKFRDQPDWRLYDIDADPSETKDLAAQHPDIVKSMADRYQAWLSEMAAAVKPVPPPAELFEHTARGSHARRPFGYGWITDKEWEKIKNDPTQWSEAHTRERLLKEDKRKN